MSSRAVHFEIPFDDGERAKTFYREVFGWNVQSMPEIDYTMVMTGPVGDSGMPEEPGFINGGMFQRDASIATPVLVLGVDDVDASLADVEANGGATVRPKEAIGDMGFAAYFTDSEGNLVGLWQSAG